MRSGGTRLSLGPNPWKAVSSVMATAGRNARRHIAIGRLSRPYQRRDMVRSVAILPAEWTGLTSWSLPWTLPRTTLLNDVQTYRVPCSDESPGTTLAKCKLPASRRKLPLFQVYSKQPAEVVRVQIRDAPIV